jgi:hypothetical protein
MREQIYVSDAAVGLVADGFELGAQGNRAPDCFCNGIMRHSASRLARSDAGDEPR